MSGISSDFEIRELTIVVVAQNHNPTILNPDFLKINGIVPEEWELKQDPICTSPLSQVVFNNNVSVIAQFDRLIFSEIFEPPENDNPRAAPDNLSNMLMRYVQVLPHVLYTAIGINPKGHVIFNSQEEALEFMINKFLKQGFWLDMDGSKPFSSLKLQYDLQEYLLGLSFEIAGISAGNQLPTPILVVGGNFHREIKTESREQRLDTIREIVEHCRNDIELFQSLANKICGEQ